MPDANQIAAIDDKTSRRSTDRAQKLGADSSMPRTFGAFWRAQIRFGRPLKKYLLKPESALVFRCESLFSGRPDPISTISRPGSRPFRTSCSPFVELWTDFGLRMLGIPSAREAADMHQVVIREAHQRLADQFLATDQLGFTQTADGLEPAENFLNALAHFQRGLVSVTGQLAALLRQSEA